MEKIIYIDGFFLGQKITGVQRYAKELVENLANSGYQVTVLAPKKTVVTLDSRVKVIKSKFFSGLFWQQLILPVTLMVNKRPPLACLSGIGPVLYTNKILAIHDASLYRYPHFFSRLYRWFYKLCYPLTLACSRGILTVSEFSKKEIKETITPKKNIFVVNNTLSKIDTVKVNSKKSETEKYILTVGSLDERKNLGRIISAFLGSSLKTNIKLYIVGGSAASFTPLQVEKGAEEYVRFMGYVSDEELSKLYQNALYFVYLSLYEGFGIPPLESLMFGCPVLLSDIPVFRELYGAQFDLVDPKDMEKIKEWLRKYSEEDRSELLKKQQHAIKKFTKENQLAQFNYAFEESFGETY
ncbi:glycosyltransferase family 4 protein [Enterobacteriaceae bacterium YMB-R22]|uniref:glycosyltransferase family 4 protein n=1 Tax=Tenebrionicola larvae TaxID=2815733 RepID=UPI0020136D6F|nr:glycosyltransferase family 1 protein [Tenebrionicola larvae]MBV4412037.1 glycosyltransferase family 4 protein [Tenebrionicola larvae]